MQWFNVWWDSIGLIGQIMACCAIPMTVVMLFQLVLMLIGAGFGGESDESCAECGADNDLDSHGGFDHGGLDHESGGLDGGSGDLDYGAVSAQAPDGQSLGLDANHDFLERGHSHSDHEHAHTGVKLLTVRGVVAFFAIGGWAGLAALSMGIPKLFAVQIALLFGAAAMLLAAYVIKLALSMQQSGNLDPKNALDKTATVYINIPPSRAGTGKVMLLMQERYVEMDAVTDSAEVLKSGSEVVVSGIGGESCLVVRPLTERVLDRP